MNLTRPIPGSMPTWVSSHQCFSPFNAQKNHQGRCYRADDGAVGPGGCVHLTSSLVRPPLLVSQDFGYERFSAFRRLVLLGSVPLPQGGRSKTEGTCCVLATEPGSPSITFFTPHGQPRGPQVPPSALGGRQWHGHPGRRARGPKQGFC